MLYGGFAGKLHLPELTFDSMRNLHDNPTENILFPMLFVVVSCGAISGFHATQSPLMARCMTDEKYGRPIFYGAMICEGIVAMIWATAAMTYFGGPEGLFRCHHRHHRRSGLPHHLRRHCLPQPPPRDCRRPALQPETHPQPPHRGSPHLCPRLFLQQHGLLDHLEIRRHRQPDLGSRHPLGSIGLPCRQRQAALDDVYPCHLPDRGLRDLLPHRPLQRRRLLHCP